MVGSTGPFRLGDGLYCYQLQSLAYTSFFGTSSYRQRPQRNTNSQKLLPNVSWHWWIVVLLVCVIGVLMESAYRAIKQREDKIIGLEDRLTPKFTAVFDRSIPSCDAKPLFTDGSYSRCIRLKVELVKDTRLAGCEAWLSIDRFSNVGPARCFGRKPMRR
jgi:hypothetical protein